MQSKAYHIGNFLKKTSRKAVALYNTIHITPVTSTFHPHNKNLIINSIPGVSPAFIAFSFFSSSLQFQDISDPIKASMSYSTRRVALGDQGCLSNLYRKFWSRSFSSSASSSSSDEEKDSSSSCSSSSSSDSDDEKNDEIEKRNEKVVSSSKSSKSENKDSTSNNNVVSSNKSNKSQEKDSNLSDLTADSLVSSDSTHFSRSDESFPRPPQLERSFVYRFVSVHPAYYYVDHMIHRARMALQRGGAHHVGGIKRRPIKRNYWCILRGPFIHKKSREKFVRITKVREVRWRVDAWNEVPWKSDLVNNLKRDGLVLNKTQDDGSQDREIDTVVRDLGYRVPKRLSVVAVKSKEASPALLSLPWMFRYAQAQKAQWRQYDLNQQAPAQFKCHDCGEVGHSKKNCPNKDQKLKA